MEKRQNIQMLCTLLLAGSLSAGAGLTALADTVPPLGVSGNPAQTVTATSGESYDHIAICRVTNYVNVRSEASTAGAVVGKIYDDCAATILSTVAGEDGDWYQIRSGSVEGYVKAEFFITGAEAEAVASQVGTTYATVTSDSGLRLREQPSLEAAILTTLDSGTSYEVTGTQDGFAHLLIDDTLEGYVSMDYISTRVEFRQAVSLEEEEAQIREKEQQKAEAEEALRKLEQTKEENIIPANPAGDGTSHSTDAPPVIQPEENDSQGEDSAQKENRPQAAGQENGPGYYTPEGEEAVMNATREAIIAYARQFLGNPYVYGGSSLTDGADCSGFVMRSFEHFGISTGRSSRDQAAKAREIPVSEVQPGDLLFYASGDTINHVAIYIGGGQIIHAGSSKTGICIANANYRTPYKAGTFLN